MSRTSTTWAGEPQHDEFAPRRVVLISGARNPVSERLTAALATHLDLRTRVIDALGGHRPLAAKQRDAANPAARLSTSTEESDEVTDLIFVPGPLSDGSLTSLGPDALRASIDEGPVGLLEVVQAHYHSISLRRGSIIVTMPGHASASAIGRVQADGLAAAIRNLADELGPGGTLVNGVIDRGDAVDDMALCVAWLLEQNRMVVGQILELGSVHKRIDSDEGAQR